MKKKKSSLEINQFLVENKKQKKYKNTFEIPKWMECSWRRITCGRYNCPLCGKIMKGRQKYTDIEVNYEFINIRLEDAVDNITDVLKIIKQDAKDRGIEITNIKGTKKPPESHKFPLYNKMLILTEYIHQIGKDAEYDDEFWLMTEEAADLFWYSYTISSKTYRQLCNRWYIKKDNEYGDFDYEYTQHVLKECFTILKASLSKLIYIDSFQKNRFKLALDNLNDLQKDILKI